MLKKQMLAIALVVCTGLMSLAHADNSDENPVDNRWYVAPFGTFLNTSGNRGAEDGWGGGMGIGKMLDKHFNVELKGFYQTAGDFHNPKTGRTGGSWDFGGGTADVQYFFSRGTFSPYTVAALGVMNISTPIGSGIGFLGELGAGFTYEVMDNLLVRSDVRYRYNNDFNAHLRNGNSEFNDMTVNVGFVIPFGDKPKAAELIIPPVAAAAAEADCSTLDADNDGVNDCNDKCFGTINGTQVDIAGCPVVLVLKGVNFKYDSAELTDSAKFILDDVAKGLVTFPLKDEIEVRGYTSSEGSAKYNQKLSERRSQSVVDYLVLKGVTNRMHAKGFGERNPVANNATEQGKEQNRRVELRWMDHQ